MFTAVVGIKANSTRLPNKNFLEINKIPLWKYPFLAALKSKYVDQILYFIDDDNTENTMYFNFWTNSLKINKYYDWIYESDEEAKTHVDLAIYNNLDKIKTDNIAMLQATSPTITEKHIDEACQMFLDGDYDCVVSVKEDRCWHWTNDGPECQIGLDRQNTQDMRPKYVENGSLYIFKKNVIKENKYRIGKNCKIGLYIMSELDSSDVDNELDFKIAELKMGLKNNAH